MKFGDAEDIIKAFFSGTIDIREFSNEIEEMLFILRQNPEFSEDQQTLSKVELLLHESDEGLRDLNDLYEFISSILERSMSENLVRTYTIDTSIPSYIEVCTQSTTVEDYHRILSLV